MQLLAQCRLHPPQKTPLKLLYYEPLFKQQSQHTDMLQQKLRLQVPVQRWDT